MNWDRIAEDEGEKRINDFATQCERNPWVQ